VRCNSIEQKFLRSISFLMLVKFSVQMQQESSRVLLCAVSRACSTSSPLPPTRTSCCRAWFTSENVKGLQPCRRLYNERYTALIVTRPQPLRGLITFGVRHNPGEMYIGHGRLCVCVCLSVCPSPHSRGALLHGPGCRLGE